MVLPMLASAQKLGHINSQELLAAMPELKDVQAKLDTLAGQYETQFANMQEEFNKKVAAFQQEQANMTAGVRDFRQQEIVEMEQRIQMFYQTAQKDIQAKQQEFMVPIQQKMMDAVKRSDGKAFFSCVLPSEARIIKLGAALTGLNEDKILEQFLKSSGGFGDNGAFPEIKDIEFEEDKIVVLIAQKDSNDIKLTFAREEGKWYVSVLDMINPFN
jgi:outer membrane protein